MVKINRLVFSSPDREEALRREDAERQTMSLAGLAVTLLVLVVCVWLTRQLQAKSAIENCLMAGRTNCDVLVPKLK